MIDEVWFIPTEKTTGLIAHGQIDYWPEERKDEGQYCVDNYTDFSWEIKRFETAKDRDEYLVGIQYLSPEALNKYR